MFLVTMIDMIVSTEERNTVTGTPKVRLETTVDEDRQSYTSRGIREDLDVDGTLVSTERTTRSGTRIVPEPLD